jgi:hypothetical protein
MFHVLFGYRSSTAPDIIDSFDRFNSFDVNRRLLTPRFSITCVCHDVWHDSCFSRGATLRINCEAVMWKITTHGFTLDEVLILAAMNLLASADAAAKHEKQASQKSKGDQA